MTQEENQAQAELEKAAFFNERIGLLLAENDEMSVEEATAAVAAEWAEIAGFFAGKAV